MGFRGRSGPKGLACTACSPLGPLLPGQAQVMLGLVLAWTTTPGRGLTGLERTFQPLGVRNIVRSTT